MEVSWEGWWLLARYCFKEESSELTEYSPSCIRVAAAGSGGGGGGGGGGGTETGPHILIELHRAAAQPASALAQLRM